MKNLRAVTMLLVAVVLGLAAVVLASRWLLDKSAAGTARVVVAAQDVSLGQRLTPDMLTLAEWPANGLPLGAAFDPAKLGGRVLKTSLLRGEPLTEAKLAPLGTMGGLSAVIAEGKRAITVRVNDVIGVAGFALPGNFVDIIVSTQKDAPPGSAASVDPAKEPFISKIVLERILVLAVAQEVNRDDTKPRVVNAVTLEVTPEQAEHLDLARSVGTLSLALRNQVDPKAAVTLGATKLTLLGEPKPAPATAPVAPAPVVRKAAAPARHCITVINGAGPAKECY